MDSFYIQTKIKDIDKIKTAYFVGIKGAGMTALAQILHEKGINVQGSDTEEKFFTDDILKDLNIEPKVGFRKGNIPENVDVVISSAAYIEDNKEVEEAKKRGLRVATYPEFLAKLFNNHYGIAVCGSHGKSTTSAMLGYTLECAGFDPNVVVGSRVNSWNSNARAGNSKYFVIEADEYRDAFLRYHPEMIILTNIDYDHPDYFKTKEDYENSFETFVNRVPKDMLIKEDDNNIAFNLKIPGEHNQKNANLAYKAALKLGVGKTEAKEALESFEGIARRFEVRGEYKGAILVDDYAHHPNEINATMQAVSEKWPDKNIVALFQPHTFSRTKNLFEEFRKALSDIKNVSILKTYGSARENEEDATGEKLASAVGAKYFKTHDSAANYVAGELDENTVFISLGAGDGWRVCDILKEKK